MSSLRIILIYIIIITFLPVSFALSAELRQDFSDNSSENSSSADMIASQELGSLVFSVSESKIGEWISGLTKKPSFGINIGSQIYEKRSMIAVKFVFKNNDQTRKIDLGEGFKYELQDEFHNQYRSYDRPKNYFGSVKSTPRHFPSIYPGETFQEVVFFENPINKSTALTFSVNAANIGIEKEVALTIPSDKIIFPKSEIEGMDSSSVSLRIISSTRGGTVVPGDRLYVRVRVSGADRPPDRIFIVSPIFALEDDKPAYTYQLNIPKDQPAGGLTIIAIAKWVEGGEEILTSESITFEVIDPNEACAKNCSASNKI